MCTRSWPTKPEIDEMFTMAPPPASRMAGTAYFMPRNTPLAFTPISASQAAVLVMSGSNVPLIPALLTSRSSFPNAVTAVFTAFCHSDSLVTSSFTNRAWPPAAAIFSTTWRASSSRTSATTTRAPSRAKIVASLCPIPLAPPVISATFPASLMPPSVDMDLPPRMTAGAAGEDGRGRVEKDPFPHRGDGPARARMEPSRSGEADACRVVRSTLPRPSSPAAPAPRAASIADRARRVHCGSTAEAMDGRSARRRPSRGWGPAGRGALMNQGDDMATYVLVHGAYQGGWIWKPVAERLRAAGHRVIAPTLDGCGHRHDQVRPGITVATHGQESAKLLFYEDLDRVMLVGTSSGGMVIFKAAELARERIARLFFIDALALLSGERVGDIVKRAAPNDTNAVTTGPTQADAEKRLFADLDPETRAWALARYTPHPVAALEAPVELTSFWSQTWPTTVVRCRRAVNPPEAHQRRTAERLKGDWYELDTGHYPMLSQPEQLTRLLLAPLS